MLAFLDTAELFRTDWEWKRSENWCTAVAEYPRLESGHWKKTEKACNWPTAGLSKGMVVMVWQDLYVSEDGDYEKKAMETRKKL